MQTVKTYWSVQPCPSGLEQSINLNSALILGCYKRCGILNYCTAGLNYLLNSIEVYSQFSQMIPLVGIDSLAEW